MCGLGRLHLSARECVHTTTHEFMLRIHTCTRDGACHTRSQDRGSDHFRGAKGRIKSAALPRPSKCGSLGIRLRALLLLRGRIAPPAGVFADLAPLLFCQ